jgi:hypothetical protein
MNRFLFRKLFSCFCSLFYVFSFFIVFFLIRFKGFILILRSLFLFSEFYNLLFQFLEFILFSNFWIFFCL